VRIPSGRITKVLFERMTGEGVSAFDPLMKEGGKEGLRGLMIVLVVRGMGPFSFRAEGTESVLRGEGVYKKKELPSSCFDGSRLQITDSMIHGTRAEPK
jgi:hypothetical protein